MQNYTINVTNSLESCLFKNCTDGHTGTILITTKNNKSCQITLSKGEVIAASMSLFKGFDVTKVLLSTGIDRVKFNKNMTFPHADAALISSSDLFLSKLGFDVDSHQLGDTQGFQAVSA